MIHIVGSQYFFKSFEDFTPKDLDTVEFVVNPLDFKFTSQRLEKNRCTFKWRKLPNNELIKLHLQQNTPMTIGKFLVKTVVEELNFTIDDLKQLKPLIDNIDEKHQYEKIIYDAIIENNSWDIPQNILNDAYLLYKQTR